MCGISGYWGGRGADARIGEQMARRLAHRGPDDGGVWSDEGAGLVLVHRRLAILDRSAAGRQPMVSPCGRYALTYNGEIYNHRELRAMLDREQRGFAWRGHSDTETLLAALAHWGVEATLERLNGMFAFGLWDAATKTLFLARDRMGEKPLYYGQSRGTFLFGSELKALRAHPDWQGDIDREALTLYLRHNYIPAPRSIYRGIAKLPPAHYVAIRNGGTAVGAPSCYWNLRRLAEQPAAVDADPEALADELDALLGDAVGRRMAADVPLGAFLSGGIDSTTVTALMQARSERPVKTFSIGFDQAGYDEAPHAKAVAAHLGTDHTELYVSPGEALAVIPELPAMYDEPFSDSSQVATSLVCRLARRRVTVALSGDGGDELFYGYGRYTTCARIWRSLSMLPLPLRKTLAHMLPRLPAQGLEKVAGLLPGSLQVPHLADRLPKLADLLASDSGEVLYRQLLSHARHPDSLVVGGREPDTLLSRPDSAQGLQGLAERMMYLDMMTYLPDDILAKVDRASMACGLEARVPLLDHRVVEFAWRVPTALKRRNGQSKWLLRQVLHRYVPEELMDRPKMGFGVPIEHWLRGPLRDWAEDLLNERRLREEGYLRPAPIRRMWDEHLSGRRRWHYHLWDVLMFQAWLREQRHETGTGAGIPSVECQ